jgi:crotonobetainyl-CoA:carnitine CoA-transferase CaiB-like acyl-CoA transferase
MSETARRHPGRLAGTRVVDLTEGRGLFAGKVLADLGADVIMVERPEGSPARSLGPFKGDRPGLANSLYFLKSDSNKRAITLKQRTPRQVVKPLQSAGDAGDAVQDSEDLYYDLQLRSAGHMIDVQVGRQGEITFDGLPCGYPRAREPGSQERPCLENTTTTCTGSCSDWQQRKSSDSLETG